MLQTLRTYLQKVVTSRQKLLWLVALLLVVIPLYPKMPLFEAIPGYIVRIRLEDFLILGVIVVWFVQVIRTKTLLSTPLTKSLLAYMCFGGLSVFWALFVLKSVPLETDHILKTVLHYFRNIQYLLMYFVGYAAVKTKKDVSMLITVMLATLAVVGLYGVGQKYFQLPVYSTMNREFSAGVQLVLTNHARVQSTFAGHYDLAAYLVILLPLVLSVLLSFKDTVQRKWLWALFILSAWLLTVTAARTSFVAAIGATYFVIIYFAAQEKSIEKKVWYFLQKSTIVGCIFLFIMIQFGSDIRERLGQALQAYPQLHATYTRATTFFNTQNSEIDGVMVNADSQPIPKKPSDVYTVVPDLVPTATVSADGTAQVIIVEAPRVYSENALKYGLSMAIRLDTLWPQALAGFRKSPVLGSGYGTLTKSQTGEFTEADSTDNNFLRTLGETGLAGFITFYGTILFALHIAWRQLKNKTHNSLDAPAIAYIAAALGLFVNAYYIDVFVASKVALTFWLFTGILVAREKYTEKK